MLPNVMFVAPPAGAWIETQNAHIKRKHHWVAPPAGAWIETAHFYYSLVCETVAPPAGAWIETGIEAVEENLITSRLPQARGLKHDCLV